MLTPCRRVCLGNWSAIEPTSQDLPRPVGRFVEFLETSVRGREELDVWQSPERQQSSSWTPRR